MRCLVTGHLGFVGSETVKLFKEKNVEVIGYDLMERADVRDYEQLWKVVEKENPDRILHLAATARFSEADKNPILAFETNAGGTENIAKVANTFHIPVVYSSTGSVYMPIEQEPPITEEFQARGNSIYACSKYIGECHLRTFHNPWIILRYSHLYGREKRFHGLIGGVLARIERGSKPMLFGGAQSNDFAYVKDIAWANYLAVTASFDKYFQVYNIGTGEEITAEKATEIITRLKGYSGEVERKKMRTVDPLRFVYDCRKAKEMLGFEAKYTFEQGMKEMLKEIEEHGF